MRLSRDLVSDPGRFNLASFRELVAFSFFLDLSNRAMERYLESGGAIYAARRRRGARVPPRCLSPPLYETRKLVKRVIMSNGRAAGRERILSSSSSSLPRLVRVSLSSPSPPLRHRLCSARRQPGDHTRRIALSLSRFDNTLTRESFRQVIEGR